MNVPRLSEQATVTIIMIVALSVNLTVTQDDRVFALIASVITGYFGWSRGNGDRPNSQ